MTTTINASPSNGIVQTADGSGVMKLQSNGVTTNALAWVNFNGTGTVAIRSSYNVSSVTDNGTGDYTVNVATALSDANYSYVGVCRRNNATARVTCLAQGSASTYDSSTTSFRFLTYTNDAGSVEDPLTVCIAVFGN